MDYEKDFEEGLESTSFGAVYYKHHSGSGKSIIFLHGFGATSQVWSKLMTVMPKELDIYLIDLLGHGKSDAPRIDYTIDVQAQVLKEFIALIDEDCYLFGHSYGGWVAAYYAAQHFASRGIILEDPAGLKKFFDEMTEEGIDSNKEEMVKSAMAVNDNKEYVLKSIVDSDKDMLDLDTLAKIDTQTVVVWGSNDKVLDSKFANIFAKGIKNCRLEIIDGAGHSPHYTHPDKINEIIMNFIA